ncbi:hypothetical protein FQN57_001855 [Myotisia sp. PD_48]|nr:hypothetical protein FQN57_001855 [Myotisia sp. PD_48]
MSFPFKIIEYVLPGQHIREYPHSINGRQETPVQLAIKQYVPLDAERLGPLPANAVTIIGVPGNGSPKEIYEPLWEDLYGQLKKLAVPVRGIWVADTSNQGASAVLNEDVQGDQIILEVAFGGPNPAILASRRRDLWECPEKAATSLNKGLRRWDSRARDRYIRYGLRPVPTRLYNPTTDPKVPPTAVTLTTTKHQEAWNFFTPNLESEDLDRLLTPDWDAETERPYLFSRPECWSAMRNLPFIRPSVLWVFGGQSFLSFPEAQDSKMRTTGTGIGGSGGAAKGMVEKALLPEGGHTLVFEQVDWCAIVIGNWMQRWFKGWLEDEKFWREYRSRHSDADMIRLSEEAFQIAQMPVGTKRSQKPPAKL